MKKAIWAGVLCASVAACSGGDAEPAVEETAESAAVVDAAPIDDGEDALVPGTEYNATSILDCSFDGVAVEDGCTAGVVRNWGEDGTHLVEIQKPDGFTRAIFFEGTTPTGADSAEADGSAGWDFNVTRDGDMVTVEFGPETYVIVDALITGG